MHWNKLFLYIHKGRDLYVQSEGQWSWQGKLPGTFLDSSDHLSKVNIAISHDSIVQTPNSIESISGISKMHYILQSRQRIDPLENHHNAIKAIAYSS